MTLASLYISTISIDEQEPKLTLFQSIEKALINDHKYPIEHAFPQVPFSINQTYITPLAKDID